MTFLLYFHLSQKVGEKADAVSSSLSYAVLFSEVGNKLIQLLSLTLSLFSQKVGDKLMQVQKNLDDIKEIMQRNIEEVMSREWESTADSANKP